MPVIQAAYFASIRVRGSTFRREQHWSGSRSHKASPNCVACSAGLSFDFTWIAFVDNEGSASANGLPWRWIPKGFISIGLVLLLAAVVSVMLRLIVKLYGPAHLRDTRVFAESAEG